MLIGRRYKTPIAFELERDAVLGTWDVHLFLICRRFALHWGFHLYKRE